MSMSDLVAPPAAAGLDKQQPGGGIDKSEAADFRKNFNYPLVHYCDMVEEMRAETIDMIVTACEKYPGNYEAAAKSVKEVLDRKCGSYWHVVIGEGFAFEITHEMRNLLYMYFGGLVGALVWKASV